MLKTKNIKGCVLLDENTAEVVINTEIGIQRIKRTLRKHTKEIRELRKQGIYCFEIQGILYWYKKLNVNGIDETNNDGNIVLVEYKSPELFRESKTNMIKKSVIKGKKEGNSIKLDIPRIPEIKKEPIYNKETEDNDEIKHKEYNTIKTCIENDIPVYLVGEAGTGKNYTLEQISWDLGLEFYFTNSVQQEYKLTGFIDAGGTYHETEFYKAFKNGGIFFLDEIDASIPEVLVLLNAAIANKYFEFPNGKVEAHKNFRVVAAGNTVGSGADELYTGRLVLDQATLDRFVIIEFDYDRNIENHLAKGNEELVDFVESLRSESKEYGIRCTFSYRCIITVTKLEKAGMDTERILKIAVMKGLSKDTINSFRMDNAKQNKYTRALKRLQRAA